MLLAVIATGCVPRTFVRKNPLPTDRGIRSYRPKPYLKVTPHVNAVNGEASTTQVAVDLVYMPDFSEEYSIHARNGFGINKKKRPGPFGPGRSAPNRLARPHRPARGRVPGGGASASKGHWQTGSSR